MWREMVSLLQHALTVVLLVCCMLVVNWIFGTTQDQSHLHPVQSYGYVLSFFLYSLRMIPLLSLPFGITNILGIVMMNTHPLPPRLHNRYSIPDLCFRVVTRGLYPELVQQTVDRNIQICNNVDLENFEFQIVTDNILNLKESTSVTEFLVRNDYVTENESLFKARALCFINDPDVNELPDDVWIIHLDEETLLTESAVKGLANFASENRGDIGQGTITYANKDVDNWITTLMDSVRVSVDYGMMRFCFHVLGCPFMGMKGSFVIVKASAEKEIGFDFGPKGSIAEDLMFAWLAWSKGLKFDFVDGEMREKSPFTIRDYLEQRKRWFVGHLFVLLSNEVPLKCKLGLIPTDLAWFLLFGNILNVPASLLCPIPLPLFYNITAGCLGGSILFLFLFGSMKSFSLRKYGVFKKTLIILSTIAVIPLAACLDAAASLYGFWTRHHVEFYIVNKEKGYSHNLSNRYDHIDV